MNSVQLIGRLTADPRPATITSDHRLATFRLAVPRPARNPQADFVTIKVWDELADLATEHLERGRRVAITGRLEHHEWGDDDDRHQSLTVVAERMEFLDASRAKVQQQATANPT